MTAIEQEIKRLKNEWDRLTGKIQALQAQKLALKEIYEKLEA